MPDLESKLSELELRIAVLEKSNSRLLERLLIMESLEGARQGPAEEFFIEAEKPAVKPPEQPPEKTPVTPVRPVERPVKKHLKNRLSSESMEAIIGGTWLNRIGVVAFIFGLGFFLKYSIDNNWIGPAGRVVIGILAGLGLLAGGEYGQRKGYRIFAQGLTGGGTAALYFSIFAAFSFYHLIGQLTAFGIMIMITTTAVLLSVRYDAYAIALLGITGGFLTPFFLSTGVPNQVGLFSYIALLNCGILALAYFKQWRSLNIINFVFTVFILILWVVSPYSRTPVWTNQIFYTIFFAIFACLAIFYNMVHRVRTKTDDLVLITANAVAFFLLSYSNLQPHYDRYIGFLPFLMAVIYFVMGYLAWKRHKEDRFLVLSLWGIAVVFLTITMPLQLHGKWITVAWAVEAAVLVWVGCYNKSYATRMAALGVLTIALLRLLPDAQVYVFYFNTKPFLPVLNLHMVPFAACIISVFTISYLYHRSGDAVIETEKSLWLWLLVLGAGLIGIYLSLEITQFYLQWGKSLLGTQFQVEAAQALTLAVLWFTEGMVLIWLGVKNGFGGSRLIGMLCFIISLMLLFGPGSEVYLNPIKRYWPVASWRSVPYFYGIAAALFVGKKYINNRNLQEFEAFIPIGASVVANLTAIAYLSLEIMGFYGSWGEQLGLGADVGNAVQMTLSVVWTLYAIGLVAAGFIWKSRPLRLMSIAIFAITIFKVFLFDLANLETIYRIISFIVLGGLLVVVSYLYQRYKDRIFGQQSTHENKEVQR